MISITQQTIQGETVWLVIATPNLSRPVEVSLSYETAREESRGGVESRRPLRAVPRVEMSFDILAEEAETTALRNLWGSLAGVRVAMPFWPDLSEHEAAQLLAGQLTVGWDEDFENIEIGVGGVVPSGRDYTCPLIVGRLQRPVMRHVAETVSEMRLELREDAPWHWRLDIAPAAPAAFDFSPNWLSPVEERTRDLIDLEDLGDGRQRMPVGDPAVRKWRQEARFLFGRADVASFLGWFKAVRGSFGAFTMPAFSQAGVDTPAAPLLFDGLAGRGFMRLASDTLSLSFITSELAETRVAFEQVLASAEEQQEEVAYLIEVYSEAAPGDVARLTPAEYPISAGGHTWSPARIEVDKIRSSLKIQDDKTTVRVYVEDLPQITPVIRHETDIPIRATVYQTFPAHDPAPLHVLCAGTAIRWKLTGPKAEFSIEPFSGILNRKIPRFHLSRTCNFAVFSPGCARLRPAEMAASAWAVQGLVVSQYNGNILHLDNLTGVPAAMANGWFDNGWVEIGTGIDKQIRVIRGSWWNPGPPAQLHLTLARPARTDIAPAGTPVVMYPGCDGSFATCQSKFGNGNAYGGAPFAPTYLPNRSTQITGGGK